MKNYRILAWVLGVGMTLAASGAFAAPIEQGTRVPTAEDWKGEFSTARFSVGATLGLGIVGGGFPAFTFLPNIATKILQPGFVSDLNDTVWIEGQVGVTVFVGGVVIPYAAHLRWDFEKDDHWTLFALGGVGGFGVPSTASVQFHPRFGVGVFYKFIRNVAARIEATSDFVGAGFTFFAP
jgi:hypothetical protein